MIKREWGEEDDGGMGKMGEGKWEIQTSIYGMNIIGMKGTNKIGNIVNSIVSGDGWELHLWWVQPNYRFVEWLCCISETNVTLYVNYISIYIRGENESL